MNKTLSTLFLITLTILAVVLQSTILSPSSIGAFAPDLNLILIIYLGLYARRGGSYVIAILAGYMMDLLAGTSPGVHTLSRASVFILLHAFAENVYPQRARAQLVILFLGTLYAWSFVSATFILTGRHDFELSFATIYAQGLVNALVGISLFWLIKKTDAQL